MQHSLNHKQPTQESLGHEVAADLLSVVADYYPNIDLAKDLRSPVAEIAMQKVEAIWDANAVYRRGGVDLVGFQAIQNYYRTPYPNGRLGFFGTHAIDQLVEVPILTMRAVLATGVFQRPDHWQINFCDLWISNTSIGGPAKVSYRNTLLQIAPDSHSAPSTWKHIGNSKFELEGNCEITLGKATTDSGREVDFLEVSLMPLGLTKRYYGMGFEVLKPANQQ